ncbi:MAG: N-acetyltransferase [Gemmatimonadetes bacterium]|nr:N-acetyltransferase [Gemmatimonadota bacterium]
MRVREIAAGESLRRFVDLAWKINAADPHWVPPLRMSLNATLDRRKHPFHRHAEVAYFLAERGGEAAGRIAAIVNHRHNEFHEEKTGFFGFFESVDDPQVADALLGAAAEWLRARGMERMRGPTSFSTNEEAPLGVLVEGFDSAPFIMMAHNPPYYDRLLMDAGLRKAKDLLAYYLDDVNPHERLRRGVERIAKREGVAVRPLNMRRFKEDVDIIKSIYNAAWTRNWGFVPMTDEEFDYVAKDFKPIVDPNLCLIAEVKGEPVGFSLALPDINQVLKKIPGGRLFPFGIFHFLREKRRMRGIRVITLGFRPGYQHQGLGALLYLRGWQTGAERGYRRGEASWILEDNLDMRRPLENMGADPYKRFRIYEQPL